MGTIYPSLAVQHVNKFQVAPEYCICFFFLPAGTIPKLAGATKYSLSINGHIFALRRHCLNSGNRPQKFELKFNFFCSKKQNNTIKAGGSTVRA